MIMPETFDLARKRLEAQYETAAYIPDSGWTKEALSDEFERHRREHPDEARVLTRAWLFKLICEKGRIAIDSDDYFVDKLEHHNLLIQLREEWRREEGEREFADILPEEQGFFTASLDCGSHVCPDWRRLLKRGFSGLRDHAASGSGTFHAAATMTLDGVITLIKRFHALSPENGLAALAERPPKTFQEALQVALLLNNLVEMEGEQVRSMGRFDLLYDDYYANDSRSGLLSREQATEMLKYFWIKFFAQTRGRKFGKPFLFGPDVNELSYLSFDAYREMNVVDPKFHVRLAKRTPENFVTKVAGCVQAGRSGVVIVNDELLVETLERHGKKRKDAEDFILIGCYEPAVMGKELNCSGASGLNLAKPVERVLSTSEPATFEEFMDAYLDELNAQFGKIASQVRRWERLWPRINPSPLLSCVTDSCLEKGLDASEGGAAYNTTGCCCVGLANAVDSLAVIKRLVYETNTCALSELRDALNDNWKNHETLRLNAIHRVPKWGNNDNVVDAIAVKITQFLGDRVNREPNARGGVFQAALYGIIVAAQLFGKHTGALPDGRLAGEPLTMNTGASPGMDKNGATSLINSVTKLDLPQFPNGTVLDVMLHPSAASGDEGLASLAALVHGHFAQGGVAIQFNIFDVETLREAQKNPTKFANLQVRVCGWNVRFTDLSPEEQEIYITKAKVA